MKRTLLRSPEERSSWRGHVDGSDVALAFFAYFLFVSGGGLVIDAIGADAGATPAGALLFAAMGSLAALLAAGLVVGNRRRRASASAVGLDRTLPVRWLLLGAALGPLVWLSGVLVIGPLYTRVFGRLSDAHPELTDASSTTVASFVLSMVVAGLLAPVGEELLFRGILYTWLRGRWGLLTAVASSALAFGLFHGLNALFPFTVVMGVVAALLYEKSGSLWPAISMHAATNLLGTAVAFALSKLF